MTTIINNKLTDETLSAWKAEAKISLGETAKDAPEYSHHAAIFELVTELQERRKVTAPPAPVVPTFDEWLEIRGNKPLGWVKDAMRESYDACRAAMLQGSQPVSNRDELPPGIKPAPELDSVAINAKSLPSNSPVTPDGWQQWVSDVVEYLENGLEVDGELEAQGSIDAKRLLAAAPQQEVK